MNSAYEIEYNRLKFQVEEIGLQLEKLIKSVGTALETRTLGVDCRVDEIIREIENRNRELELETLRFLAEYRPGGSDLRTVTVLARLGKGFSGLAESVSVLMNEFKLAHDFEEFFSEIACIIRDILKELTAGIVEEDFDSVSLAARTVEIEKVLESWYRNCEKKVGSYEIALSELLNDVRCASILEQTERILKSMISEVAYMITGSYDQPTNRYTVVALE